jgi:hypothetical protein
LLWLRVAAYALQVPNRQVWILHVEHEKEVRQMITEIYNSGTGAPVCPAPQDSDLLRIERRVAPRYVRLQGTTVPTADHTPMARPLSEGTTSKVDGFYADSINSVRTFAAEVEAISVQATTSTLRKGSALSGVRAWRPPV